MLTAYTTVYMPGAAILKDSFLARLDPGGAGSGYLRRLCSASRLLSSALHNKILHLLLSVQDQYVAVEPVTARPTYRLASAPSTLFILPPPSIPCATNHVLRLRRLAVAQFRSTRDPAHRVLRGLRQQQT